MRKQLKGHSGAEKMANLREHLIERKVMRRVCEEQGGESGEVHHLCVLNRTLDRIIWNPLVPAPAQSSVDFRSIRVPFASDISSPPFGRFRRVPLQRRASRRGLLRE